MEKSNSNYLWADLIRIFAIFGVICIHTVDSTSSWLNLLVVKVSQTSVPLFVMLSGALLLGKVESYEAFFKKRSIKVLMPWISWTIIYMVYYFFIAKDAYVISTYFSDSSNLYLSSWIKFFLIQFMTGLWFLPLIFSLYLITPALRIFLRHAKNLDIIFLLSIWFISIIIFPSIFNSTIFPKWEANLIYTTVQYLGFFVMGYVLYRNKIEEKIKLKVWYIFPILMIFYFMNSIGFLNLFNFLGTIAIFSYMLFISKLLDLKAGVKIKKSIHYLGGTVLGIYVTHQLIIYLIEDIYLIQFVRNTNQIVYAFLLLFFSAFIVGLIQKVPVLRKFVP